MQWLQVGTGHPREWHLPSKQLTLPFFGRTGGSGTEKTCSRSHSSMCSQEQAARTDCSLDRQVLLSSFCLARLLLASDIELAAGKEQVQGQTAPLCSRDGCLGLSPRAAGLHVLPEMSVSNAT